MEIKCDFKVKIVVMEGLYEEFRMKDVVIAGERFEYRKLDKEYDVL